MKGFIKRLLREDFGYRAGNLVNKAELLKNAKGVRGTGHFGTGFYFFGDEDVAKRYAKITGNREVSTIDLSKYKLLKVTDDELGYKLHDELKKWDGFNIQNIKPMISDVIRDSLIFNIEEGYDRADELVDRIYQYIKKESKKVTIPDEEIVLHVLKYDDERLFYSLRHYFDDNEINNQIIVIKKMVWDYITSLIKSKGMIYKNAVYSTLSKKLEGLGYIVKKIDSSLGYDIHDKLVDGLKRSLRRDPYLEVHGGKTTLGTELIKSLGYQGIDVRGTRLDNSMFGSVIYDI